MAKIIGSLVKLGIAKESSRGVCAMPTYSLPWVNFSFDDQVKQIMSKSAHGVIDESHEQHVTEKWGQGEIEGEIRDKSFGLILLAALGAVQSANVAGGTYDHTFTQQQSNTHQSLSLTVEEDNATYQFCLAMLNRLSLNITPGEFVTFVSEFISKKSHSTAVDIAVANENKFTAKHVSLKLAADTDSFGAASALDVQDIQLNFNKNLLRKQGVGTVDPIDIINQLLSVDGSFTLPYDDETYKDYMRDNTYKALQLIIKNDDVAIDTSYHPTITIELPRVGFQWSPDRPRDSLYEQNVSFRAFADVANSIDTIKSIVLRNQVASY